MLLRKICPYFMSMCHMGAAQIQAKLNTAITLDTPCNGVSTTPDGRIFLLYDRVDGTQSQGLPEVVEWKNGTGVPYPDAAWNSYVPGKDPASHFVRINAQRIGPDGSLWIVDTGSPNFNEPVILPEGPKLVRVNVTTNQISRVYNMGNVTFSESLLDDVRFHMAAGKAYLTDAGVPGLIILDLDSGYAIRVLENDRSTSTNMPISANYRFLQSYVTEKPQIDYVDQMEVSPDGKWFYYQPTSGGMWRIETQYLDQAFYNSSLANQLPQYPTQYALTPSTGGTSIDAHGNIYVSDLDRNRIEIVYPNGTRNDFFQDDRLGWIDAMWIDTQQRLWMPAPQQNLGAPYHNGTSLITKPLYIYTIDIGVGPSPIDHA